MPLVDALKIAFLFQLALAGILLVALGATYRQWAIKKRVSTHRSTSWSSAKPKISSSPSLLLRIGHFLSRDIPAEDLAAFALRLRRFKVGPSASAALFGWFRLAATPLITLIIYGSIYTILRGKAPFLITFPIALIFAAAIALFGARRLAARVTEQNHAAVTRKIPYALELILIFLDAGLSLSVAFERVAEALEKRQPALHDELRRTLADLRILGSQDLAFRNMAERINTPNMHSIVNILRQSIQYGSPISEAMKNAITLMRRTEILLLEEKANKLPSKITLMTLLFIFPAFIIILAAPAMIGLTSALTEF